MVARVVVPENSSVVRVVRVGAAGRGRAPLTDAAAAAATGTGTVVGGAINVENNAATSSFTIVTSVTSVIIVKVVGQRRDQRPN